MQTDLIYDVGMHTGLDAEFYLAKGFRVVGIEADPRLAARARSTFAAALADGRLTLVEAAVAEHRGPVGFFCNERNDEWGTIDAGFVRRNECFGAASRRVEVPGVTFTDVLARHGVPYYLKVDIEGADGLCIAALEAATDRPRYVSFETAGPRRFDETLQALAALLRCGYRSFKLVDQTRHYRIRLPQPAREGGYVEHAFGSGCSGPFGDEVPGDWLPIDTLMQAYMRALRREDRWSINGRGPRWRVCLHRLAACARLLRPVGWYDIHARLDDPPTKTT